MDKNIILVKLRDLYPLIINSSLAEQHEFRTLCNQFVITSDDDKFLKAEIFFYRAECLFYDFENNTKRDPEQLVNDIRKAACLYYTAACSGYLPAQKMICAAARYYFDKKINYDTANLRSVQDQVYTFRQIEKKDNQLIVHPCSVSLVSETKLTENYVHAYSYRIMLNVLDDLYLEIFDNTSSRPLTDENADDDGSVWERLNEIREQTVFPTDTYANYSFNELFKLHKQGNYYAECELGVRELYKSSPNETNLISAEFYLQCSLLHGNKAAAYYLSILFDKIGDCTRRNRYLAVAAAEANIDRAAYEFLKSVKDYDFKMFLLRYLSEYGPTNSEFDPVSSGDFTTLISGMAQNGMDLSDELLDLFDRCMKRNCDAGNLTSNIVMARTVFDEIKNNPSSEQGIQLYRYIKPFLKYHPDSFPPFSKRDSRTLALYSKKEYYCQGYDDSEYTNDYPEVLYYLGFCYEHGFGTEQDIQKALLNYTKAESMGYTEASREIRRLNGPVTPASSDQKTPPANQSQAAPSSSSGGCYVATCIYGSYDCPPVWILRRYRDDILAKTWYGRLFIHTYYAVSPTLVHLFGKYNWFQNLWRPKLDSIVNKLRKEGFSEMPYEDQKW